MALPIVFQIVFNLLGGAWTDRVGGMLMGWLKDMYGIQTAFYVLGLLAFLVSLALLPAYRWARGDGTFR